MPQIALKSYGASVCTHSVTIPQSTIGTVEGNFKTIKTLLAIIGIYHIACKFGVIFKKK
jgi:hypothetical protein